jgi:hypothetical protein
LTWKKGDLVIVSSGTGKTLAELDAEAQNEADTSRRDRGRR